MQIESSAISRSQNTTAQGKMIRNQILSGKYTAIDTLFPFFDHLTQNVRIPIPIVTLLHVFLLLQMFFTSLWPGMPNWIEGNSTKASIINVFSKVFFFNTINPNSSSHNISYVDPNDVNHLDFLFYSILIIFFISIITYVVEGIYYVNVHRFEKWTLYLIRLLSQEISSIMIHPTASFVGSSLLNITRGGDGIYWAYVIVGLVILIFFGYTSMLSLSFSARSTMIYAAPNTAFESWPLLLVIAINVIAIICSYLFCVLPEWTRIVINAAHMVMLSGIFYLSSSKMYYHTITGNTFFSTVLISMMISDLLYIIGTFAKLTLSFPIEILVPYFILIVVGIFFAIFIKLQMNKIHKQLTLVNEENEEYANHNNDINNNNNNNNNNSNNNNDNNSNNNNVVDKGGNLVVQQRRTDVQAFQLFDDLGLGSNEEKAIAYLRHGFIGIADMFVNWSLVRYVAIRYQTNSSICAVIQILSFFPCQVRLVNRLMNIICDRTDLKIDQRFLLYQVEHLKTTRQSSNSSSANDTFNKLKAQTEQCIADVIGFWKSSDSSISYFEYLAKKESRLQALWLEALHSFPNSVKFCEEYMVYLSEVCTDFQMTIVLKLRAEYIDLGHSFSVDNSFRSMVGSFPTYIKKGIVDVRGNMIVARQASNKGNSSNNSSNNSSSKKNSSSSSLDLSLSGENEVDAEVEDKVSRTLFSQAKLRMGLYHSLKDRQRIELKVIPYFAALTFVAYIGLFVGFYAYIANTFGNRSDSMKVINLMATAKQNLNMAFFTIYLHFIEQSGRLGKFHYKNFTIDDGLPFYIDFGGNFHIQTVQYAEASRDAFNTFLNDIATLADNGEKPYTTAYNLVHPSAPFMVCKAGKLIGNVTLNLKSVFIYYYYGLQELAADSNVIEWYVEDKYCQLLMTLYTTSSFSNELSKDLSAYQVDRGAQLHQVAMLYMVMIPIILFLVATIPMIVISLLFVHEVSQICAVLLESDHDTKAKAMQPIRKNESEFTFPPNDPKTGMTSLVSFNVCLIAMALVGALIFLFMFYEADSISTDINQISKWQYFNSILLSDTIEATVDTLQLITLNSTFNSTFLSRKIMQEIVTYMMKSVDDSRKGFFLGTYDSDPCSGYDQVLDDLITKEICVLPGKAVDFHDTYRCSSLSSVLTNFNDIINYIRQKPDEFKGIIDWQEPIQLLHLMNSHFIYKLEDISTRCNELVAARLESMNTVCIILVVIGVIFGGIIFGVEIAVMKFCHRTFHAILGMTRRIPPLNLLQNKKLTCLMLRTKAGEQEESCSTSQNILRRYQDALFCTSKNSVIEIVNPAATDILGYTPDQLLGQNISILFKQEDSDKVLKEAIQMLEGQSSPVFEDHVICISDTVVEYPCQLTILGMKRNGIVESFVYIIRDETLLVEQQKSAEKAKAQSENLLYQILPRGIVIKLNHGERDISFNVRSASVIFIDIVKFSEYSSSLTPQDIMGNLSLVFASFDSLLKKYPLITKIKLIGDIYMAAAGLFETEDNPQEHAVQTVRFALDCLNELEDVNVKLNASLSIRIGVNSGGPLIAGVLGSDKPVFDIIGDPINVAARLQTTDIPGKVQVSQATHDLLPFQDFLIEPRGEVFLKGKGNQKTYLVSQGIPFASLEHTLSSTNANNVSSNNVPSILSSNGSLVNNGFAPSSSNAKP